MTQRRNVSSDSQYEAVVGYSRAVRIGPFVAVAGTTGSGDNVAAQTRDALRRIETALHEAGASLPDVVRTRMYVTDISRWREVGAVHAEVFKASSGGDDGGGLGADLARADGRDRGRRLRARWLKPTIGPRLVLADRNHSVHGQRAVQMREQHRRRIGRNARFPAERRVEQRGV